MYTQEQLEKIERLRTERENERIEKNRPKFYNNEGLKINDPVRITFKGSSIIGTIIEIKKVKNPRTKHDYLISTPIGNIWKNDYPGCECRKRHVEDLSHIVIPEEVKKMSTPRLLRILQQYRQGLCDNDYHTTPVVYNEKVIKAELKNRPHISNKREKKIFNKIYK